MSLNVSQIDRTIADLSQVPKIMAQELAAGRHLEVEANLPKLRVSVEKLSGLMDQLRGFGIETKQWEDVLNAVRVFVRIIGRKLPPKTPDYLRGGFTGKPCIAASSLPTPSRKGTWLASVRNYARQCGVTLTDSDLRGIEPMFRRGTTPEDAVHAYTEEVNLSSGDGLYGNGYTG